MLILSIAEDFDELLQNCRVTAMTPLSELSGVMVMAIHLAFMLIVGVLSTKHCRTHGASEMFNVIFAIQGRDIRAAQGTTAFMTQQV